MNTILRRLNVKHLFLVAAFVLSALALQVSTAIAGASIATLSLMPNASDAAIAASAVTTPTLTATPTATKTATAIKSNATATSTATPTKTSTAAATKTSASTGRNTPTATPTSAATATPEAVATETIIDLPTATPSSDAGVDLTDTNDPGSTPTNGATATPTRPRPTSTPVVVPTRYSGVWTRFYPPNPNKGKTNPIVSPQKRSGVAMLTPAPGTTAVAPSAARTNSASSSSGWFTLPNPFAGAEPTRVAIAPQDSTQPGESSSDALDPSAETVDPSEDVNQADSTDYGRRLINLVFVGGSTVLLLAGGFLGVLAVLFFIRAKLP